MEKLPAEVGCMSLTLHVVASDVSTIKETAMELKNSINAIRCLSSVEDTSVQLVDASEQNNNV